MNKKNVEAQKERQRKAYSKDGSAQKMMSFRCDLDVAEMLQQVANKGRLINDLIREWYRARNKEEHDYHPDEDGIEIEQ